MKKKALKKDFFMEIKSTYNRFLSILIIVALGTAFFCGIRVTKDDMLLTADKYYDDGNLLDIRLTSLLGFTEDDINKIKNIHEVKDVEGAFSKDLMCSLNDGSEIVVNTTEISDSINNIKITEGRMPEGKNECVVDSKLIQTKNLKIGDKISLRSGIDYENIEDILYQKEMEIVGFAISPNYLSLDRGDSQIGSGTVSAFVLLEKGSFKGNISSSVKETLGIPREGLISNSKFYSDIYITVNGAKDLLTYTDEYDEKIDKVKDEIKKVLGNNSNYYIITRNEMKTYVEYKQDADRIDAIGKVFPVIFFLVAALISLTTMTRMVEEERTQIGTLKALGYGKFSICLKFILYAFIATITGGIIGSIIGQKILPGVIIDAYRALYENLPSAVISIKLNYVVIATIISILCTTLAAFSACYKELLSCPAELMRPVAPKNGKRVFLERVTFIWNKLKFTQKSTIRNLMRYKKRFFMTVFGIAGCMALMLVGFGLKDSIYFIGENQYTNIFTYDMNIDLRDTLTEEEKDYVYNSIKEDYRVDNVCKFREKTFEIEKDDITKNAIIMVCEDKDNISDFFTFKDRKTKEKYTLNDSGVIITEKLAKMLNVKKGDDIYIKVSDEKIVPLKIQEVSENYLLHYIFMSKEYYEKAFDEDFKVNELYIKDNCKDNEDSLKEDIMKNKAVSSSSTAKISSDKMNETMDRLNVIVYVLIISSGLLAFVVLYNLNNINITERKRELATIKVLGFYNNELAQYIYRENVILTILGTAFGALFGFFLHKYVLATAEIDMMMFGRIIKLKSYIFSALLTIGFSVLVNIVTYFKLKKINMVESLKSIE